MEQQIFVKKRNKLSIKMIYIIKNNNIKFVMSSTNTVSDKYVIRYAQMGTIPFVMPDIHYQYGQNGTHPDFTINSRSRSSNVINNKIIHNINYNYK
jgi:hypothetical protein